MTGFHHPRTKTLCLAVFFILVFYPTFSWAVLYCQKIKKNILIPRKDRALKSMAYEEHGKMLNMTGFHRPRTKPFVWRFFLLLCFTAGIIFLRLPSEEVKFDEKLTNRILCHPSASRVTWENIL
jgi:hypothetical protein